MYGGDPELRLAVNSMDWPWSISVFDSASTALLGAGIVDEVVEDVEVEDVVLDVDEDVVLDDVVVDVVGGVVVDVDDVVVDEDVVVVNVVVDELDAGAIFIFGRGVEIMDAGVDAPSFTSTVADIVLPAAADGTCQIKVLDVPSWFAINAFVTELNTWKL